VYLDDQPIEDWPSSKGKSIFKYLVAHRERPVAKEVLMEVFWPGARPDAARNNLNVYHISG
jgi:DNA-binding SARP family transcriptional activator